MDAFENVVASILQKQGYWTQTSVKVNLTKEEKREIKRHTAPRWELDIVAYRGKDNRVLVVECKSYLDSSGVDPRIFTGERPSGESRYKLFCDSALREVVFRRLGQELVAAGFCKPNPKIVLCLAAGKVQGNVDELRNTFKKNGWQLYTPEDIRANLEALSDTGYENNVAAIVTKLLLRKPATKTKSKQAATIDAEMA